MRVRYSTKHIISVAIVFLLLLSLVPFNVAYANPDSATLKPSTAAHKAYYRTVGNQLPTIPKPTNPGWVETSPTEFADADYTAVDSDDASRTSHLASATVATRWCASSEEFTFNLSSYSNITNIEIMWDGYCKTVDVINTEDFFKKSGAGAWTNVGAVPEADGAGWEIDVNDAVCYLDSGIYKIGVLVVSTKATVSTTANTYTDAMQIIVTYTPVSGAWHDVSTWTANLIARTWSSGTILSLSLLTSIWKDVATWEINLSTMMWKDISWLFSLTPPQWLNVAVWTFSLLGDIDLISFALCFLALAFSIYPLVTGEEKALPALALVVALMGMALAYLGLWYALAVAALSFILSIAALATRKD